MNYDQILKIERATRWQSAPLPKWDHLGASRTKFEPCYLALPTIIISGRKIKCVLPKPFAGSYYNWEQPSRALPEEEEEEEEEEIQELTERQKESLMWHLGFVSKSLTTTFPIRNNSPHKKDGLIRVLTKRNSGSFAYTHNKR